VLQFFGAGDEAGVAAPAAAAAAAAAAEAGVVASSSSSSASSSSTDGGFQAEAGRPDGSEIDSKWETKEESVKRSAPASSSAPPPSSSSSSAAALSAPAVELSPQPAGTLSAAAGGRLTPEDISMDENSEEDDAVPSPSAMSEADVSSSDDDVAQSMGNNNYNNHVGAHGASTPAENSTALDAANNYQLQQQPQQQHEVAVDEFNPYAFIKSLPPYDHVVPPHRPRPVLLPQQKAGSPDLTLVLDLDETLVHCSIEPISNPDLTFSVDFNGTLYDVYVRKRPHFQHFLEQVSRRFEVVVFTASQQVYAERLLNILDPTKSLIKHRLYRDACLCVEGNYLKDLTVLGRDMRKMVLVDNSPHAFGYQVDNGIPIESWFDDDNDTELLKLGPFLDRLHGVDDVRTVLQCQFNLQSLVDQSPSY
jgi:CTD small phosphatase-like protein 2